MCLNLANVYAALSQKFSHQFAVSYRPPPTYLANIIGSEASSKIVYFYIEDNMKTEMTPITSSKLKINPTMHEDLDLTGSPLKDDCKVDTIGDLSINLKIIQNPWTSEEERHRGVGVEKARSIINSVEFQLGPSKGIFDDANGSVWFLCNAGDKDWTLFLQYEFSAGYFNRGIITYKGVCPVFAVNIHSMLLQHYKLIRPGARLETFTENTYFVKPQMMLRCSWSSMAPVPSLVNLSSCDVTLSQTFNFSNSGPTTQDLLNQLRFLMLIHDDIVTYKDAEATNEIREPVYRCGRGIDMNELREEINRVMTEVSGFREMDIGGGAECDIEAAIMRSKERYMVDLTDKLWEILKCCSSYKELKMGFTILFQCAARCNIVNMPTNKNRLAEIITEVANRRLAIPCLTGAEPLELLLEIGLEKLYKDYEFIFTESKICSATTLRTLSSDTENDNKPIASKVRKSLHNAIRSDDVGSRKTLLHNNNNNNKGTNNKYSLDDMIGFKNSNFNKVKSALVLARLLQMHCALEHLLMIHINLNLTNVYSDVCEHILKEPLRLVTSIEDSMSDVLEISLSAHDVRKHLEGKHPHSRRIILLSKNKFREVKTTFFYSMDNICPPSIADRLNIEEKEFTLDNVYYCWLYRKINTIHESIKV